jgi:hypothetical protein
VPKPYPKEFRDDVVSVARTREPGQTIKQIAADFGIAAWRRPELLAGTGAGGASIRRLRGRLSGRTWRAGCSWPGSRLCQGFVRIADVLLRRSGRGCGFRW